ncbi:MAG: hypothetical protein HYX94_10050 [Chloroflexi bacterium]|nr:hypothetical protein [Chloroflexota bacterium]
MRQQLRPYQLEPARAIFQSVRQRQGLTVSVEIARQGGKNELSAQLEVLLLTMFMAKGGNLIKCSPTFKPQTVNSLMRLKERLNDAGYGKLWKPELGYMVTVGKARAIFFSADESANVVGATAHILLEVDESQDVNPDKYNKDFRPMGSTTNCTTVHYGTAWDDSSLLETVKQTNLEMERKDGIRRHFEYDWQEVGKYNPNYASYVESERDRLGPDHPLFRTQYELKPLHGGGGFLSDQQRAQLVGEHRRTHHRAEGHSEAIYVAGIDLAGEDEEAEDAALRSLKPRKDSTVATVCALEPQPNGQHRLRIVDHFYRTGIRHAALQGQLADLLRSAWRVKKVAVDATGVGQATASYLQDALGSIVQPYAFTAQSKSALAYNFLAAVNGGRLKMYAGDGSEEHREFWFQLERAKSAIRANQTMNFYVDPAEGHDDFLMSAALAVQAAEYYRPREARRRVEGRG